MNSNFFVVSVRNQHKGWKVYSICLCIIFFSHKFMNCISRTGIECHFSFPVRKLQHFLLQSSQTKSFYVKKINPNSKKAIYQVLSLGTMYFACYLIEPCNFPCFEWNCKLRRAMFMDV